MPSLQDIFVWTAKNPFVSTAQAGFQPAFPVVKTLVPDAVWTSYMAPFGFHHPGFHYLPYLATVLQQNWNGQIKNTLQEETLPKRFGKLKAEPSVLILYKLQTLYFFKATWFFSNIFLFSFFPLPLPTLLSSLFALGLGLLGLTTYELTRKSSTTKL